MEVKNPLFLDDPTPASPATPATPATAINMKKSLPTSPAKSNQEGKK